MPPTHQVQNQPPVLENWNPYTADPVLRRAVERYGAGWADPALTAFGSRVGSAEVVEWGRLANVHPPVLRTHDRYGYRIDEVEYHPSYHHLMDLSVSAGIHAQGWDDERPGAAVSRSAHFLLVSQVELGHGCPISMTWSVVPTLRHEPELATEWEPRLLSRSYDSRFIPAEEKRGAIMGMSMTEKQGGSDLRANSTRADPIGESRYRITGHKWFCSAPMSDAFVITAQAPGGLTAFLLPRWVDGERNAFHIQRLKDKLGNRSNASSEVEFDGAIAFRIGEDGRGVRAIVEMLQRTRFDCVLGAASLMRQALTQAAHHTRHRAAFGKPLNEQPLMANVLADLVIESEATLELALRLAASFDSVGDAEEDAFRRIALSVAKYWACKRAPAHVAESLECHGGSGYVEESIMPRLYREAPLYGIWEGTGNVICLDVLRSLEREPETAAAFMAELRRGRGVDRRLDAAIERVEAMLLSPAASQTDARRLVEAMAVTLEGSLLVRHSSAPLADAFMTSRLDGDGGMAFGTLPSGTNTFAVAERAPLAELLR
jgi:putative acyl-CoA dehydrogenase